MNEERKRKLVGRVSKLMAKARATTYEAEAQSFLAKAQEILAENGLSIEEIDALGEEERRALVTQSDPYDMETKTIIDWKGDLAAVIAKNFRCQFYYGWRYHTTRDTRTIVFMGMGEDTAICREVFVTAVAVAERLSKLYMEQADIIEREQARRRSGMYRTYYTPGSQAAQKANVSRKIRLAWLGGFIDGLRKKYADQVKSMPGLALVLVRHPLVDERYRAEITGRTYSTKADYSASAAARNAGYKAGQNFEHTPRAGSPRQLPGAPR